MTSADAPRTAADTPPTAGTPSGLGRGQAVLLVLLLVGATLLVALPTWSTGTVRTATGEVDLAATGMSGAPAVWAGALVAGAAALFASLARRVGTVVAGLATVAGGVVVGIGAVGAARDPGSLLLAEARLHTGTSAPDVGSVAAQPWPWGAVVTGLLLVVVGLLILTRAHRWSAAGRRFERGTAPGSTRGTGTTPGTTTDDAVREASVDDAGTPSDDDTPAPSAAGTATGRPSSPAATRADTGSASAAADAERDRFVDDWDALGRGEDPTADHR
ncbi:Trp biosynthesis-associated membrane protein [Georgenia sp. Z1344]|uniref:Trp biosynthesis-associated membrane protein n=1 Tax=Georgenia sp. Z1344 TaxID=3416706 RepID=UPI003CE88E74